MYNIIFLGPPGSGKGTQAHLISTKYGISNISAGEILKHALSVTKFHFNFNTDNMLNQINSGNLVDDELIIPLIIKRIRQDDCKKGFILDGFPRTIGQAIAIEQNKIAIDFVIEFNISDSAIINRIVGRQVHIKSGRTYHIKFNPPKLDGIDDITGEKLVIRADDNAQVILQRLNQYRKYTILLSDYYQKQSQQGNMRYFIINGNQEITKIYKELINIFNFHIFK